MIKMNEEEKMPTYGELYAENFRLEHNYRVVSEREAKLQNNWNELKKSLKEEIDICDGCIDTFKSDLRNLGARSSGKTYLQNEILKNLSAKRSFEITLNKMQELEQGKDE